LKYLSIPEGFFLHDTASFLTNMLKMFIAGKSRIDKHCLA